jgi:hypothetical protein
MRALPSANHLPAADANGSAANGCGGGAFVAVLSRERFVPAALCWHAQMRRVGSRCPLLLIWDDQSGSLARSSASVGHLEEVFGRNSLMAMSSLISSAGFARQRGATRPRKATRSYRQVALTGRRLLDRGREARAASALRYWAWALPFQRVCYMDLDLLVRRNVDELLRWLPACPSWVNGRMQGEAATPRGSHCPMPQ